MQDARNSKHLIVIAGPTASGKSALAIELAKSYNCCIISADSRQVYRQMDIGTAKPSKSELIIVTHHFIDHIDIDQNYSVGQYEKEVIAFLDQYYRDNDVAILVGGTGLYIKAVLEGLDEFPEISPEIKTKLIKSYDEKGIEYLQSQLKRLDPIYYESVDLNNPHRLIRAICVIKETGKTFSSFRNNSKKTRNFISHKIYLDTDRAELYNRINTRVDLMIKAGLLEEVRSLKAYQKLASLNTVGYKELFNYLNQIIDKETAIALIKRNSRRYAKRQITWFKKFYKGHIFNPKDKKLIVSWLNSVTFIKITV